VTRLAALIAGAIGCGSRPPALVDNHAPTESADRAFAATLVLAYSSPDNRAVEARTRAGHLYERECHSGRGRERREVLLVTVAASRDRTVTSSRTVP
jgi:hypothetical protein